MTDVAELAAIPVLEGMSPERLERMAQLGTEIRLEPGDEPFHEGDLAEYWWLLLEGEVDAIRHMGREEAVVATMNHPGQWAGGFVAWDEAAGYLATARATRTTRFFRVSSHDLKEFVRDQLPLAVHLMTGFFQTVRYLEALYRQRESLVALGTLSAGLAHELNNPASAAVRSTDALAEVSTVLSDSLLEMAESSLQPECFTELDALRREARDRPSVDPASAVEAEASLTEWLDAHDIAESWELAPTLAAAGVDQRWCERVAEVLPPTSLDPGLRWVAASLASDALVSEIREATSRVSTLVNQAKSYTQLDKASVQTIDITEGIESTLLVLAHKVPDGVAVVRSFDPAVPTIEARPAELNQVWTNLIDNALGAMDGHGTLTVTTRMDGDDVVVEVEDTGAGIPADVLPRIFDPFYTTKDVGEGTGLGLDISRRIVERHHGRIDVGSVPGRTTFAVHLPVRGAA